MQKALLSDNWRTPNPNPNPAPPPRSAAPKQQQTTPSAKRVYIGNLAYAVRKEDVETWLEAHDFTFDFIDMSTDSFTGRNPGYCFAELTTKDDVERAIATLNGLEIAQRPVKVNSVTQKSTNLPAPRITTYDFLQSGLSEGRNLSQGGGSTAPRSGNNLTQGGGSSALRSFSRWNRETNMQDRWTNNHTEQGKRLYVGGLPRIEPQAVATAEIEHLFEEFKVDAVSKIHPPHPSKQASGEGGNNHYLFVDFPSTEEAIKAMKAVERTQSPWGGQLRVSFAKGAGSKKLVDENIRRGFNHMHRGFDKMNLNASQ